jgi:SagB-type dehydrogenase family enzyme
MIRKGATGRTIQRYVPGQWWYETAAALFLMTAVFARTQWRYPFARAYRSVLFEAGHACQTFCLVATWLGLAPFCTGRFADSHVERQLRIDGITESFLYGAGVGRRPPGVAWAPWALDSSPSHPLRRRRRSSDDQE